MRETTKATIKIIVIVVFLILLPGVVIKFFNDQSTPKQETLKIRGEWCYLKTIQPGEAIKENNAGVYEYQIYATQQGIEVWGPCQQTR